MSLTLLKQKKAEQDRKIDLYGTPPLSFINSGDITVDTNGGGWVIDFERETSTRKYIPFETMKITNKSDCAINVYPNQNRSFRYIIQKGQVIPLSDFKGIRSVRISKRDAGTTITAGQIEVVVERPALTDNEYRRREISEPMPIRLIKGVLGL